MYVCVEKGVLNIDANLETQKVTVQVDESGPSADEMYQALKKWGDNANKTVEIDSVEGAQSEGETMAESEA
jgi:copper chaperone CopZ